MPATLIDVLIDVGYLVAASLFILGIKMMGVVRTARRGNTLAAVGMLIAVLVTLFSHEILDFKLILAGIVVGSLIGAYFARKVQMTAMPQFVALFNGFGGLASALVATSEYFRMGSNITTFALGAGILSVFIGAVTFTGSLVALGKLQGFVTSKQVVYPLQKTLNLVLALGVLGIGAWMLSDPTQEVGIWTILAVASVLGILLVLPIGGGDMPVVVSLLNSYSGIAAAMTGFVLMNKALIVAGTLVGAAGLILTQVMCKAMNRSLANVAFGAFGEQEGVESADSGEYDSVKSASPGEVAMLLDNAESVTVIPGYGMAVARAQHSMHELEKLLEERGVKVKYAIHPVAGRMPGHMNVLLAEADVGYDHLYEMDDINPEMDHTDVVLVIGANDVVNPVARNQPGSPIYGMPVLDAEKARHVVVIKRSLSPGFAGIKNPLFEMPNAVVLFDDAKSAVDDISKELKAL